MNRPTDEILVAYADGKLPAADVDAVEAYLAGDDDMRQFVAALKRSAELAREAFDSPMREPPSKSVADMIMAAPPHPAQRRKAVTIPTRANHGASRHLDRSTWKPIAMAASVALLVGLAAGSFLVNRPGVTGSGYLALGPIASSSIVHGALERQFTGEAIALQDDRGMQRQKLYLVATFRDRLERPCREIEIVPDIPDAHPLAAGVACRASDGRWIVEGATRLTASNPGSGNGTFYPSGIREKDAIESLLNLLGASKSLSAAEERELIALGWRK